KLTGNLNSATDLVIASGATLDLQAALTAATLDLDGTISNTAGTSSLVISGASDLNGNVTFSSTVDSDAIGTKRDLTLTLGSGSATFSGIVGTTSLADITLNSSATFNTALTADNLTIAANKTATVKDDVTIASTIALSGSSTLAVLNASTMTIAGTITDTGTGNTISVNDSTASAAPDEVTFSGTVAADTLTIGSSTTAGKAKFTGSSGVTITNITITGGNHADEDSTGTFNYALTSTAITLDDNTGDSYLVFAENNSVTIAGTIDGAANNEGTLQITGTLKTFSSAVGATYYIKLLDIDADVTFDGNITTYQLSLSANILDSGNLTIKGTSTIDTDVISQGPQIYDGDVILTTNVSLNSNSNKITFNGTVNSEASEANTLTINVGTSEVEFNGIVGGATNGGLGAITITGALNLDAAISSAASLSVSGTSNLGANVTTSGTQTYTGAVTLSAATVTLTTTDSDVTFGSTIDSDVGQTRHLTIDTNGTTGTIQFGGVVGNTVALGDIDITGNLDLDANIVGAASLSVSGTSNLGANVTTSGNQTYTGDVTLSVNTTLTTTSNGSVYFGGAIDGAYTLDITAHGTGDTTFVGAVGGTTALGDITIDTNDLTAAAITAGNLDLTNSGTGAVTGIMANASELDTLALIKAGVGTLTLSAVNTFTGDTTISAGDVAIGGSGQLGSGSYGGAISIASGSTLSFASSANQTLSGVMSGDGDVEKVTSAASTLTLSGDNTYTGGTNVSAGYLKSGSSSGASPPTSGPFGTATVTVAAGAVLDLNGQTVGNAINLSGTGISSGGAIINSNATAATISGDMTLAAHSSVGGSNAVTISGVISGAYNLTKVGSSTYTLSNTNTYTGDTTISAGTIKLTGNLNSATDLVIASGATLDLQAALTAATLDLDGTIS
ncbi:MAG: hypothetical protein EBW93_06490, partial [Betaproteobacteria bacterium]|nr:hypothetical protein [Betaproteobacteria bacterium]